MEKSNNALKSSTILAQDTIPSVTTKGKSEAKAVMTLIATAVTAVRSTVQSIEKMEPVVADAAIAALRHCEKHKDAMPLDRLVKDILSIAHPMTKSMGLELVAWTTGNSPVYWDSKKAVHLRKADQEGYKPFDLETAEKTAFYQTEQATKARKAGEDAHKKAMEPLSFKDMFGRAMGLRKAFDAALVKDKNGETRGVVKADQDKIKAFLDLIEAAARKSV